MTSRFPRDLPLAPGVRVMREPSVAGLAGFSRGFFATASDRSGLARLTCFVGLGFAQLVLLLALFAACGGSSTPAEDPESSEDDYDMSAESDNVETKNDERSDEEPSEKKKAAAAEPEFKDGMSVNEAISAVPQGTERVNIDTEDLAEPLKEASLYEPCKPAASAHFTIRVAVWDGRAVGIDITTQPNNKRLADCIVEQVKKVTWRQKAPSLNTVDYAY